MNASRTNKLNQIENYSVFQLRAIEHFNYNHHSLRDVEEETEGELKALQR